MGNCLKKKVPVNGVEKKERKVYEYDILPIEIIGEIFHFIYGKPDSPDPAVYFNFCRDATKYAFEVYVEQAIFHEEQISSLRRYISRDPHGNKFLRRGKKPKDDQNEGDESSVDEEFLDDISMISYSEYGINSLMARKIARLLTPQYLKKGNISLEAPFSLFLICRYPGNVSGLKSKVLSTCRDYNVAGYISSLFTGNFFRFVLIRLVVRGGYNSPLIKSQGQDVMLNISLETGLLAKDWPNKPITQVFWRSFFRGIRLLLEEKNEKYELKENFVIHDVNVLQFPEKDVRPNEFYIVKPRTDEKNKLNKSDDSDEIAQNVKESLLKEKGDIPDHYSVTDKSESSTRLSGGSSTSSLRSITSSQFKTRMKDSIDIVRMEYKLKHKLSKMEKRKETKTERENLSKRIRAVERLTMKGRADENVEQDIFFVEFEWDGKPHGSRFIVIGEKSVIVFAAEGKFLSRILEIDYSHVERIAIENHRRSLVISMGQDLGGFIFGRFSFTLVQRDTVNDVLTFFNMIKKRVLPFFEKLSRDEEKEEIEEEGTTTEEGEEEGTTTEEAEEEGAIDGGESPEEEF